MTTEQDNRITSHADRGVRERLLDAAENLFSERGFDGTSIRDLAAAAGCNIASVNYYFGGKEKLYAELWRRHLFMLRDTRIASIDKVVSESDGRPSLENLIRSFAYAFVGPLMDESGSRRMIKIMAREMIDPHLPSKMFGKDVIEPTLTAMQQALAKACPALDQSKVPLVVFSIIGQLVHTIRINAMIEWTHDEALSVFEPAKVIDHVVAFSAAGIRAYAKGGC